MLRIQLGLGLKGETLGVPELWIFAFFLDCFVKVYVSEVVLAFVEEHVTSVEEDQGIIWIQLDRIVVVTEGFIVASEMVVSEAEII